MIVTCSILACKVYLKSKITGNCLGTFHYHQEVTVSQVKTRRANIFKSTEAKSSRKLGNEVWKRKTIAKNEKEETQKTLMRNDCTELFE